MKNEEMYKGAELGGGTRGAERELKEMMKCSKKQSWKVGSGALRKELVKNEEV